MSGMDENVMVLAAPFTAQLLLARMVLITSESRNKENQEWETQNKKMM